MRLFASQINKSKNGRFYWATDYSHPDKTFTMQEFIEKYLPEIFDVISNDGSYAEIKHKTNNSIFRLNVKEDSDNFYHCVEWYLLT